MVLTLVGWILWGLVAVFSLSQLVFGVSDSGFRYMGRLQGIVLAIGLAATALLPVSKFHLLWVIPIVVLLPVLEVSLRAAKLNNENQ